MPDVRVLSFHAAYRCRNTGACCTADWPIPVEADRLAVLQAAMAAGRLRPVAGTAATALERPAGAPAETPAVLGVVNRRCAFHDPAGRCAIHASLGHEALPLACRQFPRVTVTDPRGTSVTLSHFCPTAAGLLGNGGSDAHDGNHRSGIMIDAPGFPATGEYVGLDARTALPPLLRPGMLMDWDAWWAIEHLGVQTLLHAPGGIASALARLRGAVGSLVRWTPDEGPLVDRAGATFRDPVAVPAGPGMDLVRLALDAVPESLRAAAQWRLSTETPDRVARRFLAAHAFANWTIHLGSGLRAWLRSIETASAFLDAGAGVRQTDLVLRHLIDTHRWTEAIGSDR